MRIHLVFLIVLIKIFNFIHIARGNEVFGCGGFIKSHADIDFSKVEIKLFNKQGSLKDKTDCSPSNGYYFIPVYDKGEYVLRISPPPGWSFEPEQVELNFDGKTDVCSSGSDVNFIFKGFGITGKVALAGGHGGARDVDVELRSQNENDVRRTTTDMNGIFSFTPIVPGEYLVRAKHPKWHFSKSEHTVLVVSGNTVLPDNSLVVSGFDVHGRLETNGQLTSGIGIALFREKHQLLTSKCANAKPVTIINVSAAFEPKSICYTALDNSGEFIIVGVAPGKYRLEPVVENKALKLHIIPNFFEFQVEKDTVLLKDIFKITGFSVSGRVLASPAGSSISNAIIKLNGQQLTKTNTEGFYTLENVQSGTYTIQVEAENLKFQEQHMKIQFATPILTDIVPAEYRVCGRLISNESYIVGITQRHEPSSGGIITATTNPQTGEWCTYLPNGIYTIGVLTTEKDKAKNIQFYPLQHNLEVDGEPVLTGISFSQLRATLSGTLICLPDAPLECTAAEITMHSLDATGQPTGQQHQVKATNGQYSFKNILPGPYELTIPQSGLCFDMTRLLVNVASAVETVAPFLHRGYEVSVISSHRAMLKYALSTATENTAGTSDTIKLLTGVNTFCVPRAGRYNIKLEGCHLYDEETLPQFFTTAHNNPIMITAIAHKIGVRVLSTERSADLFKLYFESASFGSEVHTPTDEVHKVDGKFAFRVETYLRPDELLRITPQSDILLFTPASKELIGTNECIDIAFNFKATRGLILHGKVIPAISDVLITLSFPENGELSSQTALTTEEGVFKFRPIAEGLAYELKASKDSYTFSDYNHATTSFSAQKLCEIIVRVEEVDGETKKSLSGVLISFSGAESYRKNLITGDDGTIAFHSLSPSQYFLRPMLKEYKFEPNSKIIDIKDGETIEVHLVGKRVAYSAFGMITTLNGEAFGQLNIEAIADEQCMHHQEEAISEVNGQYRVRGLQPGCKYSLRPKDVSGGGNKPNSTVERCIPAERTFKIANADVRNINFIAINKISFVDVTARITTTLNEHYKTLRLLMYRKGNSADSPIYSQRVETPLNPKQRLNPGIMVFFPRIPLDARTYIVELRSSLSDKTYSYTLPRSQFLANTSSIFVELDFKPEMRTAETELNQSSISALILVALVAIAFFKQDIAIDCLNFLWTRINEVTQDIAQKQKTNNKKDGRKLAEPINYKEIEQMAEQINSIKKKKTKKI